MSQPFEIKFDFALDDSNFIISLRATATKQESGRSFLINDFHANGSHSKLNGQSILPEQEIIQLKKGKSTKWVHKDSQMESLLSKAIGNSIDKVLDGK